MKVTRDLLRKIPKGGCLELECTYQEMQTARNIASQVGFLDETFYKLSYDRKTKNLKINHLKDNERNPDFQPSSVR